MPVWSAVTTLPWAAILKQGAALLVAAHDLRARTRQQAVASTSSADVEALRARIEALERREQTVAELIERLVEETTALAALAQATANTARQAFVLGVTGATLGVAAIIVALFAWG